MAASKRLGAILEIERRLKTIRTGPSSRFWTDGGAAVVIGETLRLGEGDPDEVIAVVIGNSEESPRGESEVYDSKVPVSIQCYAKVGTDGTAWQKVEQMLADVQRALEESDEVGGRSLDGFCLPAGFERTSITAATRIEGSNYSGGAVEYAIAFELTWGQP